MNFLDNLVLPQSPEHIELLHYMLILVLFLFIPFISILFGGTAVSLYFRKKGTDSGNPLYLRFAKDIIEMLTINKSMGIILGIVPLLTCVLVFAQLLHTANVSTVSYLIASFFLTAIGIILIYTYRYSLSFNRFFNSVKDLESEDAELHEELNKFRKGNQSLSYRSGRYGFIILLFSLWIFMAAVTIAVNPQDWGKENLMFLLFSWKVLSRLIYFLTAAFALTGAATLFGFFYWDGGRKNIPDDYKDFVRKTSLKITLIASLILPLFLVINLFSLPVETLSSSVFLYTTVAVLLLFLAYNYLYAMLKEATVKFSGHLFYVLFFALLALIVKDQLAMGNATKVQSAMLSASFEKYLAELKGVNANAVEVVSGEDIYQRICVSCHRFDQKIVGPAYDSVLPKYEGKINQLIAFIRNPVKVDPAFPPMPNPGLKPNEAKAIAKYEMIEHMKHMFPQRTAEAGENGEQIFKLICASCHSFEEDMVGPAFNSVVSKYIGKEQDLITFLSDPKKVNPDFPQMPNPQLSPGQIKAITTYVVKEYQNRQGVAAK